VQAVGLTAGNSCALPVTQIELADPLGPTAVHVSCTIKQLRDRRILHIKDRQLEIFDFKALCKIALFDAKCLHLDREGGHLDAND
jgi:hypothetical protein